MSKIPEQLEPINKQPICGIIMPISGTDRCDESHWATVRTCIERAIIKAEFTPQAVWENSQFEMIQSKIIHNLYEFPMAICDLSERNPNVMFELGMRLAFDKPTILIKDKETPSCFDIQGIKYVEYASHLKILEMEEFVDRLSDEIQERHKAHKGKKGSFLKSLGPIKVAKLATEEVDAATIDRDEWDNLRSDVSALVRRGSIPSRASSLSSSLKTADSNCCRGYPDAALDELMERIGDFNYVESVEKYPVGAHHHLRWDYKGSMSFNDTRALRMKIREFDNLHHQYKGNR